MWFIESVLSRRVGSAVIWELRCDIKVDSADICFDVSITLYAALAEMVVIFLATRWFLCRREPFIH